MPLHIATCLDPSIPFGCRRGTHEDWNSQVMGASGMRGGFSQGLQFCVVLLCTISLRGMRRKQQHLCRPTAAEGARSASSAAGRHPIFRADGQYCGNQFRRYRGTRSRLPRVDRLSRRHDGHEGHPALQHSERYVPSASRSGTSDTCLCAGIAGRRRSGVPAAAQSQQAEGHNTNSR